MLSELPQDNLVVELFALRVGLCELASLHYSQILQAR
jgi:hypothetical protein